MPTRPSRRWCSMCRDIHVAQINRQVARATCLRGLLTGEAFSVTYFIDRGLTDWVRRVVEAVRPAVTLMYSSNMAPLMLDLPNPGTRVVDLVDVDSEKWRVFAETTQGPDALHLSVRVAE
jgi:hypothetical protein